MVIGNQILPLKGEVARSAGGGSSCEGGDSTSPSVGCADTSPFRGRIF